MKDYNYFLNDVVKEMGYTDYKHTWVNASILHEIHEKASQLFTSYAFEEGCKAQRDKHYRSEYIGTCGKDPTEKEMEYNREYNELADNPFNQTK